MGNEVTKSHQRRTANKDYERYFKGPGIDIGCGSTPIYGATPFDKRYGHDAHNLGSFPNATFNYVHSSHCLEHLERPKDALKEWWRVLQDGGHLIITVPHFALYEKRQWPSRYNSDHKHYFTLKSLFDLVDGLLNNSQIVRLQINDEHFDYEDKRSDQTTGYAQAEIELIIRKVSDPFWSDSYEMK